MTTTNVTPEISQPAFPGAVVDEEKIETLLQRYNSATSSNESFHTISTPPPYSTTDEGNKLSPTGYPPDAKGLLLSTNTETSSVHSAESSRISVGVFRADKIFQVNSLGKKLLSFPTPSKELEITIDEHIQTSSTPTNNEKNPIVERYRFIRPKRSSGSGTLFRNTSDGQKNAVSDTIYRFGPGKPPVIKLFNPSAETVIEEFELKGVSTFNRTIMFESTIFGQLQWRYYNSKERKGLQEVSGEMLKSVPYSVISLEKSIGDGDDKKVVQLARFVRNEELRTEGTQRSCAGNGGRLEIGFDDWAVSDDVEKDVVEALVISGLLLMLKKEIDRMRNRQIGVMVVVTGGAA